MKNLTTHFHHIAIVLIALCLTTDTGHAAAATEGQRALARSQHTKLQQQAINIMKTMESMMLHDVCRAIRHCNFEAATTPEAIHTAYQILTAIPYSHDELYHHRDEMLTDCRNLLNDINDATMQVELDEAIATIAAFSHEGYVWSRELYHLAQQAITSVQTQSANLFFISKTTGEKVYISAASLQSFIECAKPHEASVPATEDGSLTESMDRALVFKIKHKAKILARLRTETQQLLRHIEGSSKLDVVALFALHTPLKKCFNLDLDTTHADRAVDEVQRANALEQLNELRQQAIDFFTSMHAITTTPVFRAFYHTYFYDNDMVATLKPARVFLDQVPPQLANELAEDLAKIDEQVAISRLAINTATTQANLEKEVASLTENTMAFYACRNSLSRGRKQFVDHLRPHLGRLLYDYKQTCLDEHDLQNFMERTQYDDVPRAAELAKFNHVICTELNVFLDRTKDYNVLGISELNTLQQAITKCWDHLGVSPVPAAARAPVAPPPAYAGVAGARAPAVHAPEGGGGGGGGGGHISFAGTARVVMAGLRLSDPDKIVLQGIYDIAIASPTTSTAVDRAKRLNDLQNPKWLALPEDVRNTLLLKKNNTEIIAFLKVPLGKE